MYENLQEEERGCEVEVNICAQGGQSANLRDGGYHLGTVGCETTRDGEICPVEVLFDSDTEP
jgi:hypothetical protein